MDPGTQPKVGDKVDVLSAEGKWKIGTIIDIFSNYIVIDSYQTITVPINWYRESLGWRWANEKEP